MEDKIVIKGAREHNLKNIDLELPRNKLIVFTGISGSGKSSLAFDTIYAEGQRRYMESLSSYARQFLGIMEKPDVEYIEGLSPAISIDQKTVSHNPRSTVGTITEIYDYLRLLYARIGVAYCPVCGRAITRQTIDQIVDLAESLKQETNLTIMSPIVRGRKGEYHQLLYDLYKGGFSRVRVNGEQFNLTDKIDLDRYKQHTIDVIIDRVVIGMSTRTRITEAIETALKLSKGLVLLVDETKKDEILLSENLSCPYDGFSLGEISPRNFSFNSPYGACEGCNGLGYKKEVSAELIAPDKSRTIEEGAIFPANYAGNNYYGMLIKAACEHLGIPTNVKLKDIDEKDFKDLMFGPKKPIRIRLRFLTSTRMQYYNTWFKGLVTFIEDRYKQTESDYIREEIEQYMTTTTCPVCKGSRLKENTLLVKVGGKNIAEVTDQAVDKAIEFFNKLELNKRDISIADKILNEIKARLEFLAKVGLEYLTLNRSATTLAGGESQRIRLASQIGSALVGILYVLDEPTIGLHPTDNAKLIETLKKLRDLGNTVIVVEHDEDTIRAADYIADIGPGAGEHGGKIVAVGTLDEILRNPESITAPYLNGTKIIPIPVRRDIKKGHEHLVVNGAKEHNLKNLTVRFPYGRFTVVTGVSGSGKSTLVTDILQKAVFNKLFKSHHIPGKHESIVGYEKIDKMVDIDQSPIGRTPRSNPITYTKGFDAVRQLFAATPAARSRGYQPGRFSFNVNGGRCDNCKGEGQIKIEMNFLPDVYITCDVCKGTRYNKETLEVLWKGKNISQVLYMTVEEALEFFENILTVHDKLKTLTEVGLGYIRLGQPAPTLSGGEAQRIKLASELARPATGNTLYILDEPTTGLHFADVERLLTVLQKLVDKGNTLIVIEHNLEVIKSADYIIDLGPGGGEAGGQIVATGTPEEVALNPKSATGKVLESHLFKARK